MDRLAAKFGVDLFHDVGGDGEVETASFVKALPVDHLAVDCHFVQNNLELRVVIIVVDHGNDENLGRIVLPQKLEELVLKLAIADHRNLICRWGLGLHAELRLAIHETSDH